MIAFKHRGIGALVSAAAMLCLNGAAQAWEPTRPVEFIVPAGAGGGADQMVRLIQGIVAKNRLMAQPLVVVNKATGAEGFLDVKGARGNPHKIIITLSNLFTLPLATGAAFNWRDLTPAAMLALDQFVLWVNVGAPYRTAREYIDDVMAKPVNTFRMAGTGSMQEDQIIATMIDKATGRKMRYVPLKGGGDVALQLADGHVNSTVNNPSEAETYWRGGKLRPLCVLDSDTLPYTDKVTGTQSWADIPTCKSVGVPVEYLMLRGIFLAPGVTQEQVDFYVDLFRKIRKTQEWADFMRQGAFKQTFMSGREFADWLARTEVIHHGLMKEAGFLARQSALSDASKRAAAH